MGQARERAQSSKKRCSAAAAAAAAVIKSRARSPDCVLSNQRPIHLRVNFPNNYTEYYLIQVMTTVVNRLPQQHYRNRRSGCGGGGEMRDVSERRIRPVASPHVSLTLSFCTFFSLSLFLSRSSTLLCTLSCQRIIRTYDVFTFPCAR